MKDIISIYCNTTRQGKRYNIFDEMILDDDRIRRVILANFDKIMEFEMKQGKGMKNRLLEYKANKFSVWNENKHNNPLSRYLTPSQVVVYLAVCGYALEYTIEPV